ncbi:MAG TPA: hypothetical protein VK548_23630, partial [Candidatus Acidoferrum sp.]|nr:hypothetical protein [Candidatus Acidoferrum sp.]
MRTSRRRFLQSSGAVTLVTAAGVSGSPVDAQQSDHVSRTGDYTVTAADHGKTIGLGGNTLSTLTFGASRGYGPSHVNVVVNDDAGRMKYVSVAGIPEAFRVYPRQTVTIRRLDDHWGVEHPGRWRLGGDVTVHASPTGRVGHDGLTPDSTLPVAEALRRIKNDFDINGKLVVLQLADGTYGPLPQQAGHWTGSHQIEIHGNPRAVTSVQIAAGAGEIGLYVSDYARVIVRRVLFEGAPTATLVRAEQEGIIGLADCAFKNGGTQIRSVNNGNIRFNAPCTFSGDCTAVLSAFSRGRIELGATVYTVAPMKFQFFAGASINSSIVVNPGARFTGAGMTGSRGKRYEASAVSSIDT